MCANSAGSMIIGAQGRPFITIYRTLAPFQSVLPSAAWNSRNCNSNKSMNIAIFCKMTSRNPKATYQRFGGAQRLCTVQHSSALRRRPHAPRNAGKSVPDYTVAVVKNTVVFTFRSPVTLTVNFSTNILLVLEGITYEIYCRWHVKVNGLAQIYSTIKYLLLI